MVMTRFLWCAVALLGQPSLLAGSPQTSTLPDPTPCEPVAALVEAFRTHTTWWPCRYRTNEQVQALLSRSSATLGYRWSPRTSCWSRRAHAIRTCWTATCEVRPCRTRWFDAHGKITPFRMAWGSMRAS